MRSSLLILFGMALLIMGAKLWLIDAIGNSTPYTDQWDAEASQLYKPWIEGTLELSDILAPHNEHRIIPTKLLALWLVNINELWSPLLQMAVNALVHVLAITLLVALLAYSLGKRELPLIAGIATILLCVNTGWQNTLHGINSIWYFSTLFGPLALWLLIVSKPLKKLWWVGLILGLLATISAASGLSVFAASALVLLLIFFRDQYKSYTQLFAGLICLFLFIICYSLVPSVESHNSLRADSVSAFVASLTAIWAWPTSPNLLSSLLLHTPAAIYAITVLYTNPKSGKKLWFLFALAAWSAAQILSVAYGRASAPVLSRYTDAFAVDLLINLACLISLLQLNKARWSNWLLYGWLLLMLSGLAVYVSEKMPLQLAYKKMSGSSQLWTTQAYIGSGDAGFLNNAKPYISLPYSDPNRLKLLLDDMAIRKILPTEIRGQLKPLVPLDTKPRGFAMGPLYPGAQDWEGVVFYNESTDGDKTDSMLVINYLADPKLARWIEIKLKIARENTGVLLGIEQNGKIVPHRTEKIRDQTWNLQLIARVAPGPFSVVAIRKAQGSNVQFTAPLIRGAWDSVLPRVLKAYPVLLIFGASFLFLGLAYPGKMIADQ